MTQTKKFESESKLTFLEAVGIIVGHGVGAGILSTPYLASLNNWWDFIWIIALAYFGSVLLHLMIAELSFNNDGAMFVKCIENLFKGKLKKVFTIIAFVALGFSVLCNCCAYVNGGGVAVQGLVQLIFGYELNFWIASSIFYVFCALVVFFGMKAVGICEKYCSISMVVIIIILIVATFFGDKFYPLSVIQNPQVSAMLGLFGTISFGLSAVMSVPQAVKGLDGDKKKINLSIIVGISITALLIVLLSIITKVNCAEITKKGGAMNDIASSIGFSWIKILSYIFTIFALGTSFWANTLDLRDIVHEQTKLGLKLSWLIVSIPCLILSILTGLEFVSFTMLAGAIQILTALGIVVAFAFSRKEVGSSPLIGVFGSLPFQILVLVLNLLATVGQLMNV